MTREITQYYRPKHLAEALALLARPNVRTVPLGGGSTLIAEARRDVEAVVDLRDLNLSYLQRDGDLLRVGATTTLQALIDSPESAQVWDGELARVLLHTAARNLREQGTIAGTLVSAASTNPLAVTLLALGATMTILTPDHKSVPLDEFFAARETLLRGALISEIGIPLPYPGSAQRVAFEKVSRTPADLPIVCVAARARIAAGKVHEVRLALGGVGPMPRRAPQTEQALATQPIELALKSVGEEIDPPADFLGSAEYRREMAAVLLRRAVERLL